MTTEHDTTNSIAFAAHGEGAQPVERMGPSIFRLALVLVAYVIFTVVIGITWSSYENDRIIEDTDHHLRLAAGSLKYMLAEDFHDRAVHARAIALPEELENRRRFNAFVNESDLAYVYTIVEKNGSFYFSAPTVTDEEVKERPSWYFYPYEDIPTEFVSAMHDRKNVSLSYSDQWGTFRTVCLTETSPHGNPYLACADVDVSHLDSVMLRNILTVALVLLGFILFTIPIIWSFRSFYQKYAKDLQKRNDMLMLYQENLEQLVDERTADLYRAKDEAEEASRIKSRFVANMSHEIRTPLNAIIGIADSLSGADLPRRFTPLVTTLKSAGDLLFSLVNNILDISKLESGRLELMPSDFRLQSFLDDIRNIFTPQMQAKNLAFEIVLDERIPECICTDATRYRQVLVNLLSNAAKFTSRGSVTVRIELLEDKGQTMVLRNEVQDTGIGIPRDTLPHLFELFYQGDVSMRRIHGGSGIGLNLCKHLVERMGGTIEARSRIGQGSTFLFTIQVQKGCTAGLEHGLHVPGVDKTSHLRALIAEDNISNVTLLDFYFKDSPHEADIVKNGLDAFTQFTQFTYDIVFMDLEMPIMDGFEAVRRIREYERVNKLPPTPIIALTAHATTDVMEQVLTSGFSGYLTKPITRERLFDEMLKGAKQNVTLIPPQKEIKDDLSDVSVSHETSSNHLKEHQPQNITLRKRLRDLLPGYITSLMTDLDEMQQKLEQPDFESVRKIAHKIKGSGASFGYPTITELATVLHEAAASGKEVDVKSNADALIRFAQTIGPDGTVEEPA
ncbi:ATP-binding protein [Desulfovibrio inopinatus]|uniref:ATP-binding protein n=1 Tax=Desulfovibrio inopinatus TaxID=102109 RepID=UPI0003F6BA3C|nr:ATP-binding protein [Desulfovibrio inopinatus]